MSFFGGWDRWPVPRERGKEEIINDSCAHPRCWRTFHSILLSGEWVLPQDNPSSGHSVGHLPGLCIRHADYSPRKFVCGVCCVLLQSASLSHQLLAALPGSGWYVSGSASAAPQYRSLSRELLVLWRLPLPPAYLLGHPLLPHLHLPSLFHFHWPPLCHLWAPDLSLQVHGQGSLQVHPGRVGDPSSLHCLLPLHRCGRECAQSVAGRDALCWQLPTAIQ